MHTERFSFAFSYRYSFASSGRGEAYVLKAGIQS